MNHRIFRWGTLAVLAVSMALHWASSLPAYTPNRKKSWLRSQPRSCTSRGRQPKPQATLNRPYQLYARAFQKTPKDLRYKTSYERTRFSAASIHVKQGEKLRDQGDASGALTEFMRALEIDPSNELAQQEIKAMRDKAARPAESGDLGPA